MIGYEGRWGVRGNERRVREKEGKVRVNKRIMKGVKVMGNKE